MRKPTTIITSLALVAMGLAGPLAPADISTNQPRRVEDRAPADDFVVSESQFNMMFPGRNPFYTYKGLTSALSYYPDFANTGGDTTKRREAAAFLANVQHTTYGLKFIVEQNTQNYPHYCDLSKPYKCPAGHASYYGRGPLMISWNYHYKDAGDALGIDLLNNPYRAEQDVKTSWETALWIWNSQNGAGSMTPHDAMVNKRGFGETIRSLNGDLECNGHNRDEMLERVRLYKLFVSQLNTSAGEDLTC